MITNIRGLSGSGKTTAVLNIMKQYDTKHPVYTAYKQDPTAYLLHKQNCNSVAVLGPYERSSGLGGCDVFNYQNQIKAMILHYAEQGYDVIYESMQQSISVTLPTELADLGNKVAVLFIDIPVAQVQAQRKQRSINNGGTGVFKTATGIITPQAIQTAFIKLQQDSRIITHRVTHSNVVSTYMSIVQNQPVRTITVQDNRVELMDKIVLAADGASRAAKANQSSLFDWT